MEILLRPSVPEDVPVQRTLWSLSFGDERAYINNFYKNYYRPDRVLVLEVEGAVRAMTAWFSTVLSIPGKDQIFRAAYLYAVCVHPDWRGKGPPARSSTASSPSRAFSSASPRTSGSGPRSWPKRPRRPCPRSSW